MRKYILFLLLFPSCIIQFIGITNDYDQLTENQQNKIKKLIDFSALEREVFKKANPQLATFDFSKRQTQPKKSKEPNLTFP